MPKNMSNLDRIIRLILVVALVALYFSGAVSVTIGYVALAAAAVLALTSSISFCPLYTLLKINTK